jgi:formylglycine-generating enzyme required for sulfatase activity
MRAFVERYAGNLQQWASETPSWNGAWTVNLPKDMSDALYLLGPGGKKGCNVVSQGGRTYWQPAVDGNTEEVSDFTQDVLDEKALNCVNWYMAQAICMFDGGHLVSAAEMGWVYENRGNPGGSTAYPWQDHDTTAYDPSGPDPRVIHRYSYETPNPPASLRTVSGQYPLDHTFYIAPPGRRPTGANMHGVEDAAGNVMPWVSDQPKNFVWTMSWEEHPKNLTATLWKDNEGPDGYYAIGARCSR